MASYTEGNITISLLQAYKVLPSLDLHLDPSGIWTLRAAVTVGTDHYTADFGGPQPSDNVLWEEIKSTEGSEGSVQVRELAYGHLEVLDGDPILRRDDLTGLHLRCTTLSVSWSQSVSGRIRHCSWSVT